MNIQSVINQLAVLSAIATDLSTYLGNVKTANTFTNIEGKTTPGEDTLHDKHTYYGVSQNIVDDIMAAKNLLANAKQLVYQTTGVTRT